MEKRELQKQLQRAVMSDDGDLEREMQRVMQEADDIDMEDVVALDLCKGCGKKGEGDLLVAFETCDSWWHTPDLQDFSKRY